MASMGEATLTLRADPTQLERDLAAAEERVKQSVAAMQEGLDSLGIRQIVREEIRAALRDAARSASRSFPASGSGLLG